MNNSKIFDFFSSYSPSQSVHLKFTLKNKSKIKRVSSWFEALRFLERSSINYLNGHLCWNLRHIFAGETTLRGHIPCSIIAVFQNNRRKKKLKVKARFLLIDVLPKCDVACVERIFMWVCCKSINEMHHRHRPGTYVFWHFYYRKVYVHKMSIRRRYIVWVICLTNGRTSKKEM